MFAIESYQYHIPLLFTGKKTLSLLTGGGMDKIRLVQIPKFKSWNDPLSENMPKQQMSEGMGKAKQSLLGLSIEEVFMVNSQYCGPLLFVPSA